MIESNGITVTFDWEEDYEFIHAIDNAVNKYCQNKSPELKQKILTNFYKSFYKE